MLGRGLVTMYFGELKVMHWVVFADVAQPLLGLDFTKLHNVDGTEFFTKGFLGIKGQIFPCWEGSKNNWCARVTATDTCFIPANSEMVIADRLRDSKKVKNRTMCVLDGTRQLAEKHGLAMCHG